MASAIAKVSHALIGGSANWGVRFPEDLDEPGVSVLEHDLAFDTPWGRTSHWKLLQLDGAITSDGEPRLVLYVFSHGWSGEEIDHGASRRVFWVLREAGVTAVIASSTSGSLNKGVLKGDLVLPADVIELTQTRFSLLPGHFRYDSFGKQLVCPACAATVAGAARALWPGDARVYGADAGLVAAHAWGPRLQSPAEVNAYRSLGGDIGNHSLAPEASLAREIGACFVACSFITAGYLDYFTPPALGVLGEGVQPRLAPIASRAMLHAIARIDRSRACLCAGLRPEQDPRHFERR